MLVVTRESGQTVRIGRDIEVRILSVHGRRVRVAIAAPRRISILRGELIDGQIQVPSAVRVIEREEPRHLRSLTMTAPAREIQPCQAP
jgi:carbon storage regulator